MRLASGADSRRAGIGRHPAVAAETGIALANATDPYVRLCAEYYRLRGLVDNHPGPERGFEAAYTAWRDNDDRLIATRATTPAGAVEGLKIALYYGEHDNCRGNRLMIALLESAIVVLEREVRNA